MKANKITAATKKIAGVISKNSPTILTGLGVAGLVTTTVMAVRATPKALRILEEERQRKLDEQALALTTEHEPGTINPVKLTALDTFKLTWKCYIPSTIMGAVTATCIVCANSINLRRNTALATVYSLTETTLKEYQAKVVETIGKNKEQKIKDEIAQDKVTNTKQDTVILTGGGDVLCMDLTSGRYFRSSVEKIKRAKNEINEELLNSMWISLNEAYGILDLEPIGAGWDIGWDVNRDGLIDISIRATLADNGEPCITIEFEKEPRPRY